MLGGYMIFMLSITDRIKLLVMMQKNNLPEIEEKCIKKSLIF